MNDELDLRLHEFFEAEAGGAGAPASLLARVSAIPAPTGPSLLRRNPGLVLLAAALLTALLVGGALAVGSWLSRPKVIYPSVKLPAIELATSIEPCGGTLASTDSDTLAAVQDTAGIADTGAGTASMRLYLDGRVIIGHSSPTANIESWSSRRLTPRGVQDLMAALVNPDLPGCRNYALTGSLLFVEARDSDSKYAITAGNAWPWQPRATAPAEAAAISTLARRLADPNLSLPADDWTTPAWGTQVPSRWRVTISVDAGPDSAPLLTADLTLPNGSPLREIGAYTDDSYRERCSLVGPDVAEAIRSAVQDSGAPLNPDLANAWQFSNALVMVQPLLPWEPDCDLGATFSAPTPVTGSISSASPAEKTACGYLAPSALQGSLGGLWSEATPYLIHPGPWREVIEPGWPACLSVPNTATDGAASPVIAFLDPDPVQASSAVVVAADVLGTPGDITTVAGHPVIFNGCDRGTALDGCQAAVAISVDSDFLVLIQDGASRDDLLSLAAAILNPAG